MAAATPACGGGAGARYFFEGALAGFGANGAVFSLLLHAAEMLLLLFPGSTVAPANQA